MSLDSFGHIMTTLMKSLLKIGQPCLKSDIITNFTQIFESKIPDFFNTTKFHFSKLKMRLVKHAFKNKNITNR